ncbi:MAG TPA: putative collagen-binding domain-containing protein, partial [Bacteroidales bacterium]|nr:putative collagen-binding domain-containing protein [Bacteroidales bacterium]
ETKFWLKASADSGNTWVVNLDEIGPSWKGALPDQYDPAHDTIRYKVLWGNLMAGGAGTEWYFGYKFPHSDLACEDWRSRDKLWDQTKVALDFFHTYLPFTDMKSADDLTTEKTDYCFAKEGQIYAIYLPEGKTTDISLPEGKFDVAWFNPRTWDKLIKGDPGQITGGKKVSIGTPPNQNDWVCLIKLNN